MIQSKEDLERAAAVFCYELTTADIDADGDMQYTTYGIRAFNDDRNMVAEYPDVSTNKTLVEHIVNACNLHKACVIHLEDVILDSIE